MIPGWKIRRELDRLGQQLRAIPEAVWEPFAQKRHDAMVAKGLPMTEGQVPLGARVAIVLIFQPKGVAKSVVETCAYLAKHGYAPLIVSNTALTDGDIASLIPQVWRILTRPNYGYDFGGYRDGILTLDQWGIQPAHLLILNDSVWFPLIPDSPLIAQLERADASLTGAILRTHRTPHFIESYLLHITGAALRQPAIRDYWQSLAITSNKYKVIRRGERGLSAAFTNAGLGVQPIYTQADFEARIAGQPADFLRQTLLYAALPDDEDAQRNTKTLADFTDTADWCANARSHITDILSRGHFYSRFPFASVGLMGFPLLKKSADRSSSLWRKAYARAVQDNALPAPPGSIWPEIERSGI